MSTELNVAIAQLNLLVGDVDGNVAKVRDAARRARDELACDVIVFPELCLTGYPPEDLLLRPGFIRAVERGLERLKEDVRGIDLVVGHPAQHLGALYNAASVLRDGEVRATYYKHHLPNYGVFDEKRYFASGAESCVVQIKGVAVGITICEDVWQEGPIGAAKAEGAAIVLNLNASPYHINKGHEREAIVARRASENALPIVYANLLGGQDELVFDGASFVVDAGGRVMQQFPAFAEGVYVARFSVDGEVHAVPGVIPAPMSVEESVYKALVCGVRDYIEKNRFEGVVIGLSGGIDSALTLALAVDAIGAERVEAVMMPSRYTAQMSLEDARAEAEALGVEYHVIPIEPMFQAFVQSLQEEFAGLASDVTEENIQARCRGVLLMAISNKKRKIVLATGNKSEMAVGYATLYGDMVGGYAAIKDVPKTLVYRLAHYRNGIGPVIPRRVLDRPPSAELAADQKDTDSLPPYEVLDPILEMYIEQDRCVEDIIAAGFDPEVVTRVVNMVVRNEYKRRQAAPGVRITRRAFGRDRRYPITNGFAGMRERGADEAGAAGDSPAAANRP
jgi:NAD+ synthase (glutamine-hydrolysing)